MAKSSSSERAQRINAAVALIKRHKSAAETAKALAAQYGISRRQAYRYVHEAEISGKQVPIPAQKIAFTVKLPKNLIQAIAIVVIVMLITLGFRTGLVVASLIPTAMLLALAIMKVVGIGMNTVSLAALIISLGLLVDNAIVMSESIMVQIQNGKNAIQSAVDSASELRIPLLTSSLTTAAAFMPIALAESSTGEYTAPLFYVTGITLLSSWILALTMIPLFCVLFIKVKQRKSVEAFDTRFYRGYRGFLIGILKRPLLSILAVLIILS